jgi:hypothetical protein
VDREPPPDRVKTVIWMIAFPRDGQAFAACGDKGGPGYRSASGRCVGWADIGKTCGNPPSTRCTAENTASGAEAAADLGQKAWEAGKDARKAAGRSD